MLKVTNPDMYKFISLRIFTPVLCTVHSNIYIVKQSSVEKQEVGSHLS